MSSGTLYGPTVNHWRAVCKWTKTETATTCTCTWETGIQSVGWGFNIRGISADAWIDGGHNSVSNQSFYSATGSTTYKALVSYSKTFTKKESSYWVAAACTVTNSSGYMNGSSRIDDGYTIPALQKYTVSYNANGGSGAPGSQAKYYGKNLTLSSTKPTRTGYTFNYWSSVFSGVTEIFLPGGTYTKNSDATLYANWTPNTYTVTYNANGGSGAPAAQTKTYGQTLTLSSTVPTRTNYNFKGWATSSTGAVAYQPGGNYTANAAVTLYAVWEIAYIAPTITNVAVDRCDSAGTISDEGTYLKVSFNYQLDATYSGGIDYIQLGYKLSSVGSYTNLSTYTPTGMSGSLTQVIGGGLIDTEYAYDVQILVKDHKGSSTVTRSVGPLAYIIDFSPEGGVAIGQPAENSKRFDVHIPEYHHSTTNLNGQTNVGGPVVVGPSSATNIYMNNASSLFFKDVNNSDQIRLCRGGGDAQLIIQASQVAFLDKPAAGGGFTEASSGGGTLLGVNHVYMRQDAAIMGRLTSGSWTPMLRMNTSNQVELTWTSGGLKGRVKKLIWSGNAGTNATISIPEMPYYNVFLAKSANMDKLMIGVRGDANAGIAFGISWASASFVYTMGCELKLNNGAGSTSGTLVTNPWYQAYDGTNSTWAYSGNLVKIYGLL